MDSIVWVAIIILCIPIIQTLYSIWQSHKNCKTVHVEKEYDVEKPQLQMSHRLNVRIKIEKGVTTKCMDIGHSHSDIGTVYPISAKSSNFSIIPFHKASVALQDSIVSKLHGLNPDITRDYVIDNWRGSDVFYVMATGDGDGGSVIGSVAVDRKNFEPFISHLYVDRPYRKKGYGERLLDHAIEYATQFKFENVKLWCDIDMIPYYRKHGWIEGDELKEKSLWIMTKSLPSLPPSLF